MLAAIAFLVKIMFVIRISQLTRRLLRRVGLEIQAILLTKHYVAEVVVEMRQEALTAVRKLNVEQWPTA